ncbi:MAG: sulfotransferase, partial [Acidimicrobiia bacterium]|nr:sulfotransferase [Acidimicrobiia bacterium]
ARATGAGPFLRHMLVPEVAARLGETPEEFGDRLLAWEHDALAVPEVYRLLHDADPTRLIVDKTPTYSEWPERLMWIVRHFPEARFVHLVRNPSDVIRSLVRMQLYKQSLALFPAGTSPYHVAEAIWVRHNEHIAAALATIDDDRRLLVRYEDVVAEPAATLAGVCDLLGLAPDARMADPYASDNGPVAAGAGDPGVNRRTSVESRPAGGAFYPLSERCLALARRYGY